jgi:hypothetical protein
MLHRRLNNALTAALPPRCLPQGRALESTEQKSISAAAFSMYEFCYTPHVCQEQRRRGYAAIAKYPQQFEETAGYRSVRDARDACDTRRVYAHVIGKKVRGHSDNCRAAGQCQGHRLYVTERLPLDPWQLPWCVLAPAHPAAPTSLL